MKKLLFFAFLFMAGSSLFALQADSPAVLISKANYFVTLLEKEAFNEAAKDFDARMAAALPADKLREAWQQIQAQAGSFKEKTATRTEKKGAYDIIYVLCAFEKTNLDVKIVFGKDQKIAGLFFVPGKGPEEWKAAGYVERKAFAEIDIPRISEEWPLPATLSLPVGSGPFAAVILVHGSGPNDRDESIGPNKPFRDLAWGLASKGIAVLRYEKRTKFMADKMKSLKKLTVKEETIDDVIAAVNLLRNNKKIDANKIIVLGHSLGATLIPRIAALDKRIAGFIMLAGAARPLEDLILEQYEYIFSLQDELPAEQNNQLQKIREKVANVKKLNGKNSLKVKDLPFRVPASYWLDLKKYDLLSMAKKMNRPLLVLQGERDYQVTMTDFKIWSEAFAGHKNVSLKSYPALNHLFISGTGKSTPEEYTVAGHVAAQVLSDIGGWVKNNFDKP